MRLMNQQRREALVTEYDQVVKRFVTLTEIRFKLLAFLPLGSAAAAVLTDKFSGIQRFTLPMLGIVATIALAMYNARNDQLSDQLDARASSIERSLGLPDGSFANRPASYVTRFFLVSWRADHRTAIAAIYYATFAFWLTLLLFAILE